MGVGVSAHIHVLGVGLVSQRPKEQPPLPGHQLTGLSTRLGFLPTGEKSSKPLLASWYLRLAWALSRVRVRYWLFSFSMSWLWVWKEKGGQGEEADP